MNWKRFGFFLVTGSLALTSCGTKGPNVARVGSQAITLAEFEEGYRPRFGIVTRADSLADRKKALEELVNKRLLALEARKRGLDKSRSVQVQVDYIAKELVRNELYQEEIVSKTEPTEAGLKEYYDRQGEEIRCRHILVTSQDSAKALLDSLKRGARFDSLARRHSIDRSNAENGGDLGFFTYGMMVDAFWDAAAKLKPGQVSGIVKTPYGFHLLLCEQRRKRQQEPFDKAKATLRQEFTNHMMILRRQMTNDYIKDLKEAAHAKVDTGALTLLASKVPKAAGDTTKPLPESSNLPVLSNQEKKTVVLRFAGGTWDLARLLEEGEALQVTRGTPVPYDNPAQMSLFLDQVFLWDLLYEKAKAKGLDRSAKVSQNLASFTNDLLAGEAYQALVEEKAKQISEEELRAYFAARPDSFKEPEQIRLSRIIVPTEQEAKALLAELKKGKSFADLARAKSKDQMTAQAGGDLGFVSRGVFPELDSVIASLKPNQLSNPVPFRGAFSILKVSERKEARLKTFEEARADVQARVHAEKVRKGLEETIAELKKTYPVTLNEQALEKLGQGKKPRKPGEA
jgi:parvulin-like peptidyl-prolyl isomerase